MDLQSFGDWVFSLQWLNVSPDFSSPSSIATFTTTLILIVTSFVFLYSSIDSALLSFGTWAKGRPPLPPGSFGLPIIGDVNSFLTHQAAFIAKKHAKYGPVFKTNVFGKMVFIQPPGGNRFVFQNEGKLIESSWPKSFSSLWGPNALLLQPHEMHRLARRHMAPVLKLQSLTPLIPRIERILMDQLNQAWKRPAGASQEHEVEIPLAKSMETVTFAAIVDFVLGSGFDKCDELLHLLHTLEGGFGTVPFDLPGTTFRKALRARERIQELFSERFVQRRAELQNEKSTEKVDLMTYLLTEPDENGRMCTDAEIHDHLILFLGGGYDSTTTMITLVMRFIALHPEVRERVMKEHDAIAKRKQPGEGLKKDDLAEMKYTWWCSQETMRFFSLTALGMRKTLEDLEYGGYSIPKGWKIAWTTHAHQNEQTFKEPTTFDPSRFDGSHKVAPYSYIPFGGGSHICAGMEFAKMEMLVVIYHVTQNYNVSLVYPDEPFTYFPFPRQKSKTLVRVSPR